MICDTICTQEEMSTTKNIQTAEQHGRCVLQWYKPTALSLSIANLAPELGHKVYKRSVETYMIPPNSFFLNTIMPMYSDQPVVNLPYCGYSERFLKSLIKKKPIDDMLPMDIPDPWYNSHHMVISAEQSPSWLLKSLPTSSPMYCSNKRITQSRQKSSLHRNTSIRTTNTTCSTRTSNNRTRNLPALPSTSSPKPSCRSPAALPSNNKRAPRGGGESSS